MEAKNKHIAEKAIDEEKHSKGIFSFMKKYREKKEIMEQMQPNRKLGIFALFKRKEENMLDKKPKEKEEVTDKLSKPNPNILSLFRKKETVKEEGAIEHYKKQIKKQQRKRETMQERRHKLLNYIERAGLGIPQQTLSKTIFNI